MATRIPPEPRKSVSDRLKALYKKSGKKTSLKVFVRTSDNAEVRDACNDWFLNKTANFSNPPKGIGNTRKSKKANQKTAVAATVAAKTTAPAKATK